MQAAIGSCNHEHWESFPAIPVEKPAFCVVDMGVRSLGSRSLRSQSSQLLLFEGSRYPAGRGFPWLSTAAADKDLAAISCGPWSLGVFWLGVYQRQQPRSRAKPTALKASASEEEACRHAMSS